MRIACKQRNCTKVGQAYLPRLILSLPLKQHVVRSGVLAYLEHLSVLLNLPWRLEVFLTIVFAVVAGILITRSKDRLLTVTCLAIGISVLEALLDAKLALPLIVLPMVAISVYVAYKVDWKAVLVAEQALKNR
jgi:hypothetical protein